MANLTKTLTANGSHGHHKFTLTVEETATSVPNNTSTIKILFKLSPINTGWNWEDYNTNPPNGTVKVNGTSYSWSLSDYDGDDVVTLVNNKTQTVTHASDGSKSISLSFTCSSLSDNYLPGSASASGTFTLTKIARASSFSVSKGTLGTKQTITVTKQNSAYTHTITAKAGSKSQTVCTKATATSVDWTPALTLAQANTTGTSVSVTLTLQTYSGSTAIGDPVTKTVSCTIPTTTVKAKISSVTLSDPEGFATTFGGYLQGKSKVQTVIAVDTGSAQGATAKKAEMTIDGATASISGQQTSYTLTSNALSAPGTQQVNTKITDTRGVTSTNAQDISVIAYEEPAFSQFSIGRCTQTGTDDDTGEWCKVKYEVTFTSLKVSGTEKNTTTLTIKYKAKDDEDWTTQTMSSLSGEYIFAADSAQSFTITANAADAVGSVTSVTVPLSTASVIMHFASDGYAMGIGKIEEHTEALDVGWDLWVKDVDMTLSDTEYDEVKPSGSTGDKRLYKILKGLVDKIANKVDKVTGKGLSTNDYTTAEKDKLAGIGTILGAVNGSTSIANKSVAGDDSTVNLGSFTVPPGVWVVKVLLRWNNNSTGNRMVWISDSATGDAYSVWNQMKVPASPTGYTYVELVTFLQPTASKTFYVNAGQNSGKALTVATRWGAIRVA